MASSSTLDDEEYAKALAEELTKLKLELNYARHVRDEGKRKLRQTQAEKETLVRQKEQRSRYREMTLNLSSLQKQLDTKKLEKVKALEEVEQLQATMQQLTQSMQPEEHERLADEVSELTFTTGDDGSVFDPGDDDFSQRQYTNLATTQRY